MFLSKASVVLLVAFLGTSWSPGDGFVSASPLPHLNHTSTTILPTATTSDVPTTTTILPTATTSDLRSASKSRFSETSAHTDLGWSPRLGSELRYGWFGTKPS
ncbi:unnamed protein product [Spodoptera littoralis]|uniref:Uncharacterized protein n=1 Tax=Spodoptera littoralis TaxID=7109 RepID=A0A9P0IC36_SPOLI|nr:unnamed protein product [Spodoptera littoralis]CAH1642524.1 unnamed protein product [Spodoptera littoralis]